MTTDNWMSTKDVAAEYGSSEKTWRVRARAGVVVVKRVKSTAGGVAANYNQKSLMFERASIEAFMRDLQGWLTTREVMERYGYSKWFWYDRAKDGEVVTRKGGTFTYEIASIEGFLADRRQKGMQGPRLRTPTHKAIEPVRHEKVSRRKVEDISKHLEIYYLRRQLNKGERQEMPRLVIRGISYPA